MYWTPPIELNTIEKKISQRTQKAKKLFVFLREHRHQIINEELEQQLIAMYQEGGSEPAIPGQLAMATLLQAYCHVSDKEAVELTVMDRRWQMVLNCLECERPPFSQATLVSFRERLIAHDMDKALLNRTVEIAEEYGDFGHRQLRAVLDSSPLLGAGRVEDTFNLLGHALLKAVRAAAKELKKPVATILAEAQLALVGKSSLKAALDLDWGQPNAKTQALTKIVEELERWKQWVSLQAKLAEPCPPLEAPMAAITQILAQDTEPNSHGTGLVIKNDVASDRRVSIEDPQMRHGRKSKNHRFNGFKEHLLTDLDSQATKEVVVFPANVPEQAAIDALHNELQPAGGLHELQIDLAYAAHPKLTEWEEQGVKITTRPWPERARGVFAKRDFQFDFEKMTLTCPAGQSIDMVLGQTVHFAAAICNHCPLRKQCMTGKNNKYYGRGIKIRKDEQSQANRRAKVKTPEGRAELRQRVLIEHRIAHQIATQGRKARYLGTRKNQFNGRRNAAVNNLQLAQKYWAAKPDRAVA